MSLFLGVQFFSIVRGIRKVDQTTAGLGHVGCSECPDQVAEESPTGGLGFVYFMGVLYCVVARLNGDPLFFGF